MELSIIVEQDASQHIGNTPLSIKRVFDKMRSLSRNMQPWSYTKRMQLLQQLWLMHTENEEAIVNAVNTDFGCRSRQLCQLSEIWWPLSHIKHTEKNLKGWMKDERVSADLPFNFMAKTYCVYQPLGVILCLAPWNFPLSLITAPLAQMLAAGNRVILKPSERAPQCSSLLSKLIPKYFADDEVVVFEGDHTIAKQLTSLPFDHILFTGGAVTGKKVLLAAAENLVPTTLELGGKNPVLVAPDYPIADAARTIIRNKLMNSGQVCQSPDYVLVPNGRSSAFADACAACVREDWGNNSLLDNDQYCSIINLTNFERIKGLVSDARKKGAKVMSLDPTGVNEYSEKSGLVTKYPPTLILQPFNPEDIKVMQQEIFGPLLVVMEMESVENAVDFINARERSLAFYGFTRDNHVKNIMMTRITSGGVTINEIAKHAMVAPLPFGGVGHSGMGAWNGITGFRRFSHKKSVYEHKRNIVPALALPITDTEVYQLMLTNKFKWGKICKTCFGLLFMVAMASMIWWFLETYNISITRK